MGMFHNRVAWIHGAAGAVGLACAHSLAEAGATVVLSGHERYLDEPAHETALPGRGGNGQTPSGWTAQYAVNAP